MYETTLLVLLLVVVASNLSLHAKIESARSRLVLQRVALNQLVELMVDFAPTSIDHLHSVFRIKQAFDAEEDCPSHEAMVLVQDFLASDRIAADIDLVAEDMNYVAKCDQIWMFEQLYAEWKSTGCDACEEVLYPLANLCGYADLDDRQFGDDEDGLHGGGND